MRRLALGLFLSSLPFAVPAALAEPAPPPSKAFDGWTAACNNLDACVVLATAQDDLFYIRIARDAGATAPVVVKIVLSPADGVVQAAPAVFRLAATTNGRSVDLGAIAAKSGKDDPFVAALSGEAAVTFVAGLRDADELAYAIGAAKGTLSLKGLSAALRWIDVRQGRAGTPTALVARGMTPIGQVPAPPIAPVVDVAAPGSMREIARPVLSPALIGRAVAVADCEEEVVRAHEDAQAWRLGPDLVLVAVPCTRGAYNFASALFFSDEKGGDPRPANLPQPAGIVDMAANVIVNGDFDVKTATLADFSKGRGIGDCGQSRAWVWTGRAFAPLSISELDACPGTLPEDWPNLYTARRR